MCSRAASVGDRRERGARRRSVCRGVALVARAAKLNPSLFERLLGESGCRRHRTTARRSASARSQDRAESPGWRGRTQRAGRASRSDRVAEVGLAQSAASITVGEPVVPVPCRAVPSPRRPEPRLLPLAPDGLQPRPRSPCDECSPSSPSSARLCTLLT